MTKKPEPTHTQNDLLNAISEMLQSEHQPDGAFTTQDIVAALGMKDDREVRRALRWLLAKGQLEETHVRRPILGRTISGRPIIRARPAYRLKPNNEPE